jgi:hypothetical protein
MQLNSKLPSHGWRPFLFATGLGLLASCGGGGRSDDRPSVFAVEQVSNGFGQILPHTTFRLGANSQPTQQIVSIRTQQDLLANVRLNNPVRPGPSFDAEAKLPDGQPGNHFLFVTFSEAIDIASVLSPSPGQAGSSGLTGAITVVALDPVANTSVPITGAR